MWQVQNDPYWAVLDDQNGPRKVHKTAQAEVQNGPTLIRITYTYAVD